MAPAVLEKKTERIEARATPSEKSTIETAARLRGESLRDFIVSCAKEQALRTIREMEILTLTDRERRVFIEALLNSPPANAKAVAAAKRYRQQQRETA